MSGTPRKPVPVPRRPKPCAPTVAVIRNARHWRTGERIDVAIEDGVIRAVPAAGSLPSAGAEIDARGAVLAPGLVDLHVHLREPGQSAKETIAHRHARRGGRRLHRGGVHAQHRAGGRQPGLGGVGARRARARPGTAACIPIAAVTVGQKGEQLTARPGAPRAGAVALSDDGRPVMSAGMMRHALEYAPAPGCRSSATRRT